MTQTSKQEMKIKIPTSFEKIFSGGWDEEGFPLFNHNSVGILGHHVAGKSKIYTDKKLFTEDDTYRPLIFHFYDFCMSDFNEHSFLNNAIIIEDSPDYRIKLSKGKFDLLIPSLFLNEVNKIIKYGLMKSYEQKEDNLVFAKGKVNFKGEMTNELKHRSRIACKYWDLTTDTFYNQVILYACSLLSSRYTVNKDLKYQFTKDTRIFQQQQVSLRYINASEFCVKRKVPKRYTFAFMLAEAIIKRYYHSIEETDDIECPSFMMDASKIWESFLRVCLKKGFNKADVYKRQKLLTILKPNVIGTPDIVVKCDSKIIIIDAKYKSGYRRVGDLYQAVAYLASYRETDKIAYLLYLEWENEKLQKTYKYYPEGEEHSENSYEIKIIYLWETIKECCNGNEFHTDTFIQKLIEIVK